MKIMKIMRSALAVSALSFSMFLSGCDEFSALLGGSCESYASQYTTAVASEGALVDRIDPTGDFSMAMVLNATAINKLFAAATSWKYTLDMTVIAFDIQLPTIQVGGCRAPDYKYTFPEDVLNCLTFDIPLTGKIVGQTVGIETKFGIPVDADIIGTEKTRLFVNLEQAQLLKLNFKLGSYTLGLDYILPLIEDALKYFLRNELKRVHLFDIAAWEIGNRQIRMLAGSPRVNEQEGTLMFGMYSNLLFAQSTSVRWEEAFPKDAEIGFHIHPDLIRGLIARMMYEGHVTRTLSESESGSNDVLSGVKITMANMAQDYPQNILLGYDPDFQRYFTMAFRLWNMTAFCGYMDILAGLHISLSDQAFSIGIGNVKAGKAAGAMTLAASLLSVVTSSQFFADVLSYANYSINFDEITVPDGNSTRKAKMDARKVQFNLDGNGISLYLNFLDL